MIFYIKYTFLDVIHFHANIFIQPLLFKIHLLLIFGEI